MSYHGTLNGYTYHRCRCDLCAAAMAAYRRELAARPGQSERAAERRAAYKQRHGGSCVDCGKPTSLRRIGEPAERCDECRRKHLEPPHGSASRYKSRECRCDLCRAAATAAHRDWSRRRAASLVTSERPWR